MSFFGYIFPFLFAGIWILINYIISKMAWADLVKNYETEASFSGHRVGIISASINGISYNNALILRFNEEGIYLRPVWVFRLFHKPVLIPWKEIKEVRDRKFFFFNLKEIIVGNPFVAKITMRKSTFSLIENNLLQYSFKN